MPKSQTDASKRARRSKWKGKAFEKSVAEEIARLLFLKCGITADCDVTTTRSGQDDCDIGLSKSAQDIFPFWVECKNQKNITVPAWLEQVREAQERHRDNRIPCIVFKQHGDSKKHAIIPFETLVRLMGMLKDLGAKNYLRTTFGFISLDEDADG